MKQAMRLALAPLNLDVVSKSRLRRAEVLSQIFCDLDTLTRYPYGYFQRGGSADGTLWATHDAGFFSCLTTIMWTVIDIIRSGYRCYSIDNSLGMCSYKESLWRCTYYELFEKKEKREIDEILTVHPKKLHQFNHHSSYHEILESHLGYEWAVQFLKAYLTPSSEVLAIAKLFETKYRISQVPTISVCYRGTDKHTEVTPTPIPIYFNAVNRLLIANPEAEILIQTDQAQVRQAFLNEYGSACKYIEELPVTQGATVLHGDRRLCGNREMFAKNLYAMCIALSKGHVLVTHTGNVGLFLALHSLIEGKQVIQFN